MTRAKDSNYPYEHLLAFGVLTDTSKAYDLAPVFLKLPLSTAASDLLGVSFFHTWRVLQMSRRQKIACVQSHKFLPSEDHHKCLFQDHWSCLLMINDCST